MASDVKLHDAPKMGCMGCAVRGLGFCRFSLDQGLEAARADTPQVAQVERVAPARRPIFRASDRIDGLPVICAGWGAVVAYLPNGRRQILSFPLPGEFISSSLVFADVPFRDVEAVTPVHYRSFDRATVRQHMTIRPGLFERLFKDCITEKERLEELAIDLGRRSAEERVARLILDLTERLAKHDLQRGSTIDFPLRQTQIADALGLTPVYTNQVLRKFRNSGILKIVGRTLTVLDPLKLSLLANR